MNLSLSKLQSIRSCAVSAWGLAFHSETTQSGTLRDTRLFFLVHILLICALAASRRSSWGPTDMVWYQQKHTYMIIYVYRSKYVYIYICFVCMNIKRYEYIIVYTYIFTHTQIYVYIQCTDKYFYHDTV